MRIAILADIHGNVPALEAVLADIATQEVDEVLVGGDLVGRGPQGSRVVQRIRSLGYPTIGGNHEDYLLEFRRGAIPADWRTTEEWAAARFMAAELENDDVAFIQNLEFRICRPGLELVHGTPASNREGIGPWTSDAELCTHLDQIREDVLVCAHTHRPLERRLGQRAVINVGSVGLPFNRDRRAQYAILSCGSGIEVELRQVEYDLDHIFAIYKSSGFLAAGGITARLLLLELEHAESLLVPFLEWARVRQIPATLDALEPFLAFRQPGESLRDFFQRLHR